MPSYPRPGERGERELNCPIEVGLDPQRMACGCKDRDRFVIAVADQAWRHRHAELGDRVQGGHQELRYLTQVRDAGEEVDQHRANVPSGCDPLEDVDEPRGIAAQLAGADVAEIEGGMA